MSLLRRACARDHLARPSGCELHEHVLSAEQDPPSKCMVEGTLVWACDWRFGPLSLGMRLEARRAAVAFGGKTPLEEVIGDQGRKRRWPSGLCAGVSTSSGWVQQRRHDPLPNESEITLLSRPVYNTVQVRVAALQPQSHRRRPTIYVPRPHYTPDAPDCLCTLYDLHEYPSQHQRLSPHFITNLTMSILSQTYETSPRARHSAPALTSSGKNSTPFPAQPGGAESEAWDHPPEASHSQRTVRRKKSSFDLRDVFKNGGVLRPSPSVPVA